MPNKEPNGNQWLSLAYCVFAKLIHLVFSLRTKHRGDSKGEADRRLSVGVAVAHKVASGYALIH